MVGYASCKPADALLILIHDNDVVVIIIDSFTMRQTNRRRSLLYAKLRSSSKVKVMSQSWRSREQSYPQSAAEFARAANIIAVFIPDECPARVDQWLDHLGAMCSTAWRAQCAVGSRFNSSRGPVRRVLLPKKAIIWNNSYAHDDQGDNPGQATEGSTVSSIKCDRCWHLD